MNSEQHSTSPLRALDRQMGEGLWRIVARVDDLLNLKEDGWEGLVSLFNWCAVRGSSLKPIRSREPNVSLPEDDVAIQCYRALHLILNTTELEEMSPYSMVESLRTLVYAGEKRHYPQLSIASLDLLGLFHEKKIAVVEGLSATDQVNFWNSCWRKMVESFAEASERSSEPVSSSVVSNPSHSWVAVYPFTARIIVTLMFRYPFPRLDRAFDNIPFPC